ncbi:unnamed protein product [Adineta steineri]|uniref:DED domain-containing protein n=1 Tax=Adineta steineri TaxID=433720 RepID=A0A813ZBS8_9BILA|nr:unnamed protein product [Adineta steineri]CAF1322071.1 unnamed protein product [Adineta steineri]CAF1458985.1 unnamed protein product [Adineta steineri]
MLNNPQLRFRTVLLNILDRLSVNERKKLSFLLADDIERTIQDDPTIGGTLNIFQQLFDRDKISNENFSYLIEAFQAIKCYKAATSLTKFQKDLLKNQSQLNIENNNRTLTTHKHIVSSDILEECLKDLEEDTVSPTYITQTNGNQTNNNHTILTVLNPINDLQNQRLLIDETIQNHNKVSRNRKKRIILMIVLTVLVVLILASIIILLFYHRTSSLENNTVTTPSTLSKFSTESFWKKNSSSTNDPIDDERCRLPLGNSCTDATPGDKKAAGLGVYYEYPCSGVGCNFNGVMCRICAKHPSQIGRPYPKCPECVPDIEVL